MCILLLLISEDSQDSLDLEILCFKYLQIFSWFFFKVFLPLFFVFVLFLKGLVAERFAFACSTN